MRDKASKKYPRELETVEYIDFTEGYVSRKRQKVPGGWLVFFSVCDEDGNSCAVCFLPDPEYKWKLEKRS